jgi:hypothetical protein
VFDGELISSVKMSSVNALAIARSSRVSNWVKVSPRRRTSMARQLCRSVAVATQPMVRSTPTVISPSAISAAILGKAKEVTAEFFPAAFLSTLPVRLRAVGLRPRCQGSASSMLVIGYRVIGDAHQYLS